MGKNVSDTESWIAKARSVHGDRYDYSKTVYTGSKNHLTVICRKHGEFSVLSERHTRGSHCQKCSIEDLAEKRRADPDEFIRRCKRVHGDRFDYSKTKYFNSQSPITVICKKHGEFKTKANRHLSGGGCEKCAHERLVIGQHDFESRSNDAHKGKYDYSESTYKRGHIKVKIICPDHGPFWQTPACHMAGQGCPKCSYINRPGQSSHVYVMADKARKVSKIGIAKNPKERLKSFNAGQKKKFSLVFSVDMGDYRSAIIVESICHKVFEGNKHAMSRSKRPGRTECFSVSPTHASAEVRRAANFVKSYDFEASPQQALFSTTTTPHNKE